MTIEDTLRRTYDDHLGAVDLSLADPTAARRAGARMRVRRRLTSAGAALALVAVAAAGTLVGTGRVSVGPSNGRGHWRELPAAPLSPRADAQSVWTAREVIVLGGEKHPCPPNADCAVAGPLLRDGAAYDPETDAWRPIADAPVPIGPDSRLVVADGDVVLRPTVGPDWFAYDPEADRWSRIPDVPAHVGDLPSALGSDVYVLAGRRVAVYSVTENAWSTLPPDPLTPRLGQRRVTATTAGPVVTGIDSTQPSDGHEPSLAYADVWDDAGWHRLPRLPQLYGNSFTWTGSRMVDPEPYTLDGGEVDGWGRAYPMGGVLDPATGAWGSLPEALLNPPQGGDRGWGVSASGGPWFAVLGQVYDDTTGKVSELPPPEGAPFYGTTAAWADDRLFAFGGAGGKGSSASDVTNRAWLWTP